MATFEYPYQNLSLENIKGEYWKDIPNFEGYYMISNMGRTKRLASENTNKDGSIHTKREMIMKPQINRAKNVFKNDILGYLAITLTLDKVAYHFSLSRLVYYCFVEKFDMKDETIFILNKDCNGLNVYPKNLIKSTAANRSKRMVARGRMDSQFNYITRKEKQVTQYSLKGEKIKTYPSCKAAEKATGIFATAIGNRAGGNAYSTGGYMWRWGNEEKIIDIEAVKKEKIEERRIKNGQKVTQYDFEGNKIATFHSLQEAELATSTRAMNIGLVLKGKQKSAKGFFWKKGFGKDKIDLSKYKWGGQSRAAKQSKKVKQLSLDGVLIKTYPSIKDAAAEMHVSQPLITLACRNQRKTAKGYRWKYA